MDPIRLTHEQASDAAALDVARRRATAEGRELVIAAPLEQPTGGDVWIEASEADDAQAYQRAKAKAAQQGGHVRVRT